MSDVEPFRPFADLLPEALLLVTGDGVVVAANQATEDRLGVPLAQLRDGRLAELATEDAESIADYLRVCARSRTMVPGSLTLRNPEGPPLPYRCEGAVYRPHVEGTSALVLLRLVPKRDASSQFVALNERVAELTREIARRKVAEEAWTRNEQTLRFLADASSALAVLVDYENTLRKVAGLAVPFFADWSAVDVLAENGSVRRLAVAHVDPAKVSLAAEIERRYPQDLRAERGVPQVLRSGQAEFMEDIPDQLLIEGARDEEHLRILRDLGLKSYVCVPIKMQGRTMGVITFVMAESRRRYSSADLAVAEDLAHRAGVAIENARLYQQLREADRRKNEFLATLAHELRNPLAPVRNGLEIMRLAADRPEAINQARAMMERQLGHLVRLIDDLLDVSRITRGLIELRTERVDLASVVQSALEASRSAIETAGHQLTVTLPRGTVHLDADPTRLAQVISNILNNAARYTPSGGRIWLTAERQADQAVVRVRDTGLGIPPEMLPRVFDMFGQINRALERSQGGVGIGLALVRNLVQLHGGTVEAHSAGLGQGSEFIVRLPLAAQQPEGGPGASGGQSAPADHPAHRILVIDDNVDAADSLAMLLRMMRHEVLVVHDGPAGIEVARREHPDLIFLDIGLPTLSGYEVAQRMRREPELDGVRIIALTGWGQPEDRRRSHEAGFDEHLVKPVDPVTLTNVLRDAREEK